MTTAIPEAIQDEIERRLRSRDSMVPVAVARLAAARGRATDAKSAAPSETGIHGKGYKQDRMAKLMQRIMRAEDQLAEARRWVIVLDRVDESCKAEGLICDDLAFRVYQEGQPQTTVAAELGLSRKTVAKEIERYLVRVAIAAAGAGLLREVKA